MLQPQAEGTAISVNPFTTAVPLWGHISQISSTSSPKRDCGSEGVNSTTTMMYYTSSTASGGRKWAAVYQPQLRHRRGGAVYLWASWASFENPNTLPVWHTSYNITLIATLWGRSKKVEKLQQCTYRWTSGRNEIHQEMHGNLMVRAWGGVEWLRSGCAQHLNAHLVLASLNPRNSNWHCYHVEGVDSCARHQQQTASPTELKNSKLKEEDKQVSGAG